MIELMLFLVVMSIGVTNCMLAKIVEALRG